MIKVRFMPDNLTVEATPGESLLAVAERAGLQIPTGCLMGSCHACEVDLEDYGPFLACISPLPAHQGDLTVYLYHDPSW